MAIIRAQVVFHTTDEVPENYVTNTLHFSADDADVATCALIKAALNTAYSAYFVFPAVVKMDTSQIKFYDLADSEPRAPIVTYTNWYTGTAPSGDHYPREVSLCLSYQAAQVSGVPQSRRRGRIYFGPVASSGSTGAVPSSSLITKIAAFGTSLLASSDAAATWNWVVYSKVLGTSSNVIGGWVDNAWDTQRRRGIVPSARTTW